MGYFRSFLPNAALAKEVGTGDWWSGIQYLVDALLIPGMVFVAVSVMLSLYDRHRLSRTRRAVLLAAVLARRRDHVCRRGLHASAAVAPRSLPPVHRCDGWVDSSPDRGSRTCSGLDGPHHAASPKLRQPRDTGHPGPASDRLQALRAPSHAESRHPSRTTFQRNPGTERERPVGAHRTAVARRPDRSPVRTRHPVGPEGWSASTPVRR